MTLYVIIPTPGIAQNEATSSTILGLKSHYGFIIPHSSALQDISSSNPWGIQLDWSKLHNTQKAWNQCNCYSKVGLSFTYFNYANPDELGSSYNLILFGEPYLTFRKNLFFTFRAGIGFTYLDQVYHELTNPRNTFHSSPLSFIVLINFAVNYQLSPGWNVHLAANYNHTSNGGTKYPNKGMNFPTLGLGVDYAIKPLPLKSREKVKIPKGQIRGYGRLYATSKTVQATDQFPQEDGWLYGIAGGVNVRIANFNALSSGIEIFRDHTLPVRANRRGIIANPNVLGWAVGHHFIFGKFNFNQQMIYYLYKPFQFTDKKFYQRYELAYQLNDFLLAGISLKSHAQVAENFDIRLGIVF